MLGLDKYGIAPAVNDENIYFLFSPCGNIEKKIKYFHGYIFNESSIKITQPDRDFINEYFENAKRL